MSWKKSQIVYQIFVDRFNKGPDFAEKVKKGLYLRDGGVVKKWSDIPTRKSHGMEFFGGDIDGIVEKLDYIRALGANVIYLTPVFFASTNHKYDTHEFKLDPQFGDEISFKRLLSESHRREIRVVLDGVFNHVGSDGKWFNRSKKYGSGGAFNEDSQLKDFFCFQKWPNEYRCWHDAKFLPELNLKNEKLREILFTGDDSVVKHYLKMGADGWRLDCAHDLTYEVNNLIVESARSVSVDSCVIGEVSSYPFEWFRKTKLDGVMNYYFANLVLNGLKGTYTPYVVKIELDRMVEEIGVEHLSNSWNMLTSHDTPRLNSLLNDDVALKRMALIFQIAYPGNPLIYYGEENGMDGENDPDNRRPMVWDEKRWDWKFRNFVIDAMKLRKKEPALNGGKYLKITTDPSSSLIGFARRARDPQDTLFFFANFSNSHEKESVPIAYSYFMHHVPAKPILGEGTAIAKNSQLEIELAPKSAAIFKFKPEFSNYTMYKGV